MGTLFHVSFIFAQKLKRSYQVKFRVPPMPIPLFYVCLMRVDVCGCEWMCVDANGWVLEDGSVN